MTSAQVFTFISDSFIIVAKVAVSVTIFVLARMAVREATQ